jgi:hypothetical protein
MVHRAAREIGTRLCVVGMTNGARLELISVLLYSGVVAFYGGLGSDINLAIHTMLKVAFGLAKIFSSSREAASKLQNNQNIMNFDFHNPAFSLQNPSRHKLDTEERETVLC